MFFLPALSGLAGCAEIGLVPHGTPPPPLSRPVLRAARAASATFGSGLVAHRQVDGLRIDIFVIGQGSVRGNLLSELKSPESRLTPPLMAALIRHPKEGVILFGAGLPEDMGGLGARRLRGSALSPFKVASGGDILSRLKAVGIKSKDVKTIILPDLAPQWAGRVGAFPNATLILSSLAWTNPPRGAREKNLPDPRAFISEERLKIYDFSRATPYGTFDHGIDLFEDGTIILIDLDGGAAGGIGAWVNLDSGPVLLTGPGAFVYDNIFDAALPDKKFVVDIPSFAWNTRAMRLASEAAPRLVILPAYDFSTLKISPRPDITLAP